MKITTIIMGRHRAALTAFLALTAGIGGGIPAQAQKVQKPFAVKLGLRFPGDGTLKTEIGDTWFYGGLSYDIAQTRAAHPLVYQFFSDFTLRKPGGAEGVSATGTSNFDISDLTGRLFGIGPAVKLLLSPSAAPGQFYVGLGAGYYRATVPDYGVTYNYGFSGTPIVGYGIVGNRTEGRFGGKLFAGYQLSGGFFGEADYTYVGAISGTKPGGVGLRIGYCF